MIEPSNNPPVDSTVPDDQRNLMHIQYAPLVVDGQCYNQKKSKTPPSTSSTQKSNNKGFEGKSFQKVRQKFLIFIWNKSACNF